MFPYIIMAILIICLLVNTGILRFKSRKSREIYDQIIAHRGLHINAPENTLKAYNEAITRGFSIEIDIRLLKDKTIVCFHDRYTKRLLGVPGELKRMTYDELSSFRVLKSDECVPKFSDVLELVNGQVALLIEVKGCFNSKFKEEFLKEFESYPYKDNVYFHVKNVLAYFRLKRIYKDKVFYILNPFRQRFEFVKGKHYKKVSIPSLDDLIFSVENTDTAKTIISKIWRISNRYETRCKKNHWLFNTLIAHRGIYDAKIPENSKESFKACAEAGVAVEADFVWYNGEVRCYHSDKASNKLGQPTSCAEKIPLEDSITLKEFLEIINGKVPIIFDIKDAHFRNRRLELAIMQELKNYEGKFVVQSFNPKVVNWFKKNYPKIHRGQVGHSLRGLRNKVPNPILIAINFLLFYTGQPDYIMYDLDKNVHILPTFNSIVGLPVLGYAPKSEKETYEYKGVFDNFVCENLADKSNWSEEFLEKKRRDI